MSRTSSASDAHVRSDVQASRTTQPSLAVLIAGQASRFSHSHMNLCVRCFGLRDVDAHVVLSQTVYTRVAGPVVTAYPEWSLKADELQRYLRSWLLTNLGFRAAAVQVLTRETLEHRMGQLDALVAATEPELWRRTEVMRSQVVHGNVQRWVHNGRMLYVRHLAFASALHAEAARGSAYVWILCLREDNRFLVPSQPLPVTLSTVRKHRRGFVALDTHCSFLGAPADKIFLADRKGADALHRNSTGAFVELMVRWLRFGQMRMVHAQAAGRQLLQQHSGSHSGRQMEPPLTPPPAVSTPLSPSPPAPPAASSLPPVPLQMRTITTKAVTTKAGTKAGKPKLAGGRSHKGRHPRDATKDYTKEHGMHRAAGSTDPLQSEAFMVYHLREERVTLAKWPFERTDVRFEASALEHGAPHAAAGATVAARPCVRSLYMSCGPPVLRTLPSSSMPSSSTFSSTYSSTGRGAVSGDAVLPMCFPTTPHDRALWVKMGGRAREWAWQAAARPNTSWNAAA